MTQRSQRPTLLVLDNIIIIIILDDYKVYQDYHIINRKPHPVAKEITYVTSDAAGKTPRNLLLKDIATAKNDPLKNLRHFHAIVEQTGKEEDNLWLVKAILTDMDWCLHK